VDLTNAERESHINQCASDRSFWIYFTDDPVRIAQLDKLVSSGDIELITARKEGKEYRILDGQVSIRKKRKPMSEKQRAAAAKRLAAARSTA